MDARKDLGKLRAKVVPRGYGSMPGTREGRHQGTGLCRIGVRENMRKNTL